MPRHIAMQEWNGSRTPFTEFAKVGDTVDDELHDYFMEVVPPITNSSTCLQCGEPYSHNENGATYITFERLLGCEWTYAGIKNRVKQ